MANDIEALAAKLRRFIDNHDLRRRVDAEMKAEFVRYARQRHDEGASFALISRELGMHERTLTRWFHEANAAADTATFVAVDVAPDAPSEDTRLLVTLPTGLRIEGSDVARISSLIRRLA